MDTRLKRFVFSTCGIVAAVMAFTQIARADDYKTYPGANCVLEDATTYGNGTPHSFSFWGSAYANFNSDLTMGYDHVVCPLTRDNVTNTNGLKNVKVRGWNSGQGRRYSCELWSTGPSGGASGTGTFPSFPGAVNTTINTSTATTTGFVTLNLITTRGVANGYYTLHCEIPPNSYIYSILQREIPDTNTH